MITGKRIKVTKNGRVGVIIETRTVNVKINPMITEIRESAKVKLDDAKSASWYWLTQLEEFQA